MERAATATGKIVGGRWYTSVMRLPPFQVTNAAIDELGRHGCVRVDVADRGCCGTAYVYDTELPAEGDEVYGCDGAWLVVSRLALPILDGARLDYGARLKPPRFRVVANPNTPLRCPCNRSFGQQWPGPGHPDCQARTPMPWN
jgi:iron-sulfur cluster assembly accessory protein